MQLFPATKDRVEAASEDAGQKRHREMPLAHAAGLI